MGITELYSIDNHQTDKLYYEAWDKAITDGKTNGNTNKLNELIKTNNKHAFFLLFGNLGKYTNRTKVLQVPFSLFSHMLSRASINHNCKRHFDNKVLFLN